MESTKIGKLVLSLALPAVIGAGMATVSAEDLTAEATEEKGNIANAEETKEEATEESKTVAEETVENKESSEIASEKTEVEVESETEQIETEKAEEETKVEEKEEEEEISDPVQETKVYVASFDTNGGQGVFKDISTGEIPAEDKFGRIRLHKDKPTREGYTFVEWNSERDGSGAIGGREGERITIDKNYTLYARWAKNAVRTVGFDANGGDTTPANIVTDENGIFVLPDAVNKDGYTFSGWNTKADGSGYWGAANQRMFISASDTVYAIYREDNANNNQAPKDLPEQVNLDQDQEVLATTFNRGVTLQWIEDDGIASNSTKIAYFGDDANAAGRSYYYDNNLKGLGDGGGASLAFVALKSRGYATDFQSVKLPTANSTFKINLKNGSELPTWPKNTKITTSTLADYINEGGKPTKYLVMSWKAESGALFWKSTKAYKTYIPIYAFKYDDTISNNNNYNSNYTNADKWENAESSAYDSNTDNWGPLSLKYSILPNNSGYELVSPVYFQWGSGVQSGRNIHEFGKKMGISSYEVQDGYLEGIHETIFLRGSFPRDKDSWLRFATIYDTCPVDRTLTIYPDKAVGKVEFMRVKIYGLENAKKKTLGQALRKSYYENALIGFIIQDKNGNKKVCFMKFGVFGELIDQY